MNRWHFVDKPLRSLAFAACAAFPLAALGQSWPAKSIRLIVPYAAGGATDSYARTFGPKFADAWGQQVIVENRPGADRC
jgi:tripartite-type tricarboxylate transporter receptor subunit TctC